MSTTARCRLDFDFIEINGSMYPCSPLSYILSPSGPMISVFFLHDSMVLDRFQSLSVALVVVVVNYLLFRYLIDI